MLKKAIVLFVGLFVAAFGLSANAALDPSIATGITGLVTDATSLNGLIVPAMFAIFGMVLMIKLVKRFGNKL